MHSVHKRHLLIYLKTARHSFSTTVPRDPVLVSGIQPTGTSLHLGNYLGAIQQWTSLQHEFPVVLYSIADLHALTSSSAIPSLSESTRLTCAWILASGIDPTRSAIFVQSRIPAHTQLSWILTCLAPMGELSRMTQWKSKSDSQSLKLGLFSYPVLMAADILLYQATHVPVGEDQLQHLELTRDLARTFNTTHKTDVFLIPSAITTTSTKRIMSLSDARRKMSKSDGATANGRIDMLDSDDAIRTKIMKAVTDSGPTLTYDPVNRPALANLLAIYAGCRGGVSAEQCVSEFGPGHAAFKRTLVDAVVAKVAPIRSEYMRLVQDVPFLESVLESGTRRAEAVAQRTLDSVMKMVGLK